MKSSRAEQHAEMEIQTIDCRQDSPGPEFTRSLHETGFAVLRNHPVPRDLLDRLYADWLAFFSSDAKCDYLSGSRPGISDRAGFFPQHVSETAIDHTVKDLKEFYHVVSDGPIPAECEQAVLKYRELAFSLGRELLGWLQQHTPAEVSSDLSEPLPSMLCEDATVLRILHYPPLVGDEASGARRAAAHEDINLLTILPVSDQAGLQVKDNAGNWIDVGGNAGDLVINTGDMMREATNDYYPSTTHRVLNPDHGVDNVSRISIPLFLTPRLDVVLSPRYTAGEYLEERLRLISR